MRVLKHFLLWNLGLADPETQTTPAERETLGRHARGRRRVVEVGVWHGVTTCQLRAAMAPDGLLFAVDPYPLGRMGWSAQRVIARREVGRLTNGHVHWLRRRGADAAHDPIVRQGGSIDFIFIDGEHSYEGLEGDWLAWSPLIATGGIVALHDSCSSAARQIEDAGSVRFTHDVILRDRRFELVDIVDTLTVLRARPPSRVL